MQMHLELGGLVEAFDREQKGSGGRELEVLVRKWLK